MSINLPEPWVGGELADELPDDPAAMKKVLDERFGQMQRNFDALAKGAMEGSFLQRFLQLEEPGDIKIAFGSHNYTWTNASDSTSIAGLTHGLDSAPIHVFGQDFDVSADVRIPMVISTGAYSASTFDIKIATRNNGTIGAHSRTVGWLAIG